MALVPVSPGATVEARPAPFVPQQAQFDPNAFGAGIGQATQGLGQEIGKDAEIGDKIATNMAIQNDTRAAKASDTQHQTAVTALGFTSLPGGPEGNKGYYSLQGQDAVTYRPAYEKALNDSNTAISDGLKDSPRAQNFYNAQAGMRVSGEVQRSAMYANSQGLVADNHASAARLSAYQDSLTVNYNDPTALANFQQVTRGEVADTGRRMGWGTDEIAAATTKALSGGYRDAILARAASGDVVGAKTMFDSLKSGMDAATNASLAQHLEPQVYGAKANAWVNARVGVSGAGASPDIYTALKAQEGPGTSDKGAVEGLMPATFQQYAKEGERFSNVDDRRAVNRRVIDDLSVKANGDPERIAVGYFSGPGNMSAPGSPTPYITDKSDGHKLTSQYVADINRRLGRDGSYQIAGPPVGNASDANMSAYPDFAGMYSDAADQFKDDPKQLAAVQSRIAAAHQQYDTQHQAVRDNLSEKRVTDTIAALEAGNDTVEIPAMQIRSAFRPGVAEPMIASMEEARTAGQIYSGMQFASPAQIAASRQALAEGLGPLAALAHLHGKTLVTAPGADPTAPQTEGDPAQFVQRQKDLAMFDRMQAKRTEALTKDPAAFAMQEPSVAAAYKAVDQQKPETVQAAVDASFSSQRTMGVADPRVLTSASAAAMVKTIETPTQGDMGAQLNKLEQQYGSHYGDVIADLTKAGLSPRYQQLAHSNLPEQATVNHDAQAAFQMFDGMKDKSEWAKGLPFGQEKLVGPAVEDAVAPYRKTLQGSTDPHNTIATVIIPAITQTAQYYMTRGMPAQAAVDKAAALITKSYKFDDELRVPTAPGMPTVSQVRGSMTTLTSGLNDADLRGTTAAEARYYGTWMTNPDDKGATLFKGTSQGGYMPVRKADGSYLSVDFKRLPTATTGPAAAVSQAPAPAAQALGAMN